MLQHIALTVNDPEEIENFYEKVLLFDMKYKFSMNGKVPQQIFNIKGPTDVRVLEYQNVQLEIFVSPQKEKKVFSHICLGYWEPENSYRKAVKSGYKALLKHNESHDTYFIWDKSNNMFEIKEMQE